MLTSNDDNLKAGAMSGDAVILCATHRLVRRIRFTASTAEGNHRAAVQRAPKATTITHWLDELIEAALLHGRLPLGEQIPRRLARLQESMLWRQAVSAGLATHSLSGLLDEEGLARTAMEANALVELWGVRLEGPQSDETQQFLRWREAFRRLCKRANCLEPARHAEWQIARIADGQCVLPSCVLLAGFDRLNPQEARLCEVLHKSGVAVDAYNLPTHVSTQGALSFPDSASELAASVAWAKARVGERIDSVNAGDANVRQTKAALRVRIGIVVPDLAAQRNTLLRLLDEAFAPEAFGARHVDMPRPYNLSLGVPLADVPLVSTALSLLALAQSVQRVSQRDLGKLLTGVGWAGDVSEAAMRARLDADLREHLPFAFPLRRAVKRAWRLHHETAESIPKLAGALANVEREASAWQEKRSASAWCEAFQTLLSGAGWPGEQALGSHAYQAVQAFEAALASVVNLDEIGAKLSAGEARRALLDACRETLFQPQTEGQPTVQVMGLLEAALEDFDALWVTGLTDGVWPPPPRPNPLLPAQALRSAAVPNGSPDVQASFAAAIHTRLATAAPELIYSWPEREGERELRASPLLAGVPRLNESVRAALPVHVSIASRLLAEAGDFAERCEWLDDHRAPPVIAGERVSGGTGLLKAQAICPAWAYFQYRLGARALKVPVEGLDVAGRGTLAHAVLEAFWHARSSREVFGWDSATRNTRIDVAVNEGIAAFEVKQGEPLPARFRALEATRLRALIESWLMLETQRSQLQHFTVLACEAERHIEVNGVRARVFIDRIDQLDDGRLVILDYKTGRNVDAKSWADTRISEPQLPIYATYGGEDAPVAAIAFAHLGVDPPRFVGLASEVDLLPGVADVEAARKIFDESRFADWQSTLATWRSNLAALADEIHAGEAGVSFEREKELMWCEVLPLLRLAERERQLRDAAMPTGKDLGADAGADA